MNSENKQKNHEFQPFLKWVGGKRQLAPKILELTGIGINAKFKGYIEPFLGGGSMFYYLRNVGLINQKSPKNVILSDINLPLVITYQMVQQDVEGVIKELQGHRDGHYKELKKQRGLDRGRVDRGGIRAARGERTQLYNYYYQVRDAYNVLKTKIELGSDDKNEWCKLAAMFLYLNRVGFNGMYRENAKGEMNIPAGRYSNPEIINEAVLRKCALALKGVKIKHQSFGRALSKAKQGYLVYLDPPYFDTFNGYSSSGFNLQSQVELGLLASQAAKLKATVVISNSYTKEMKELYLKYGFEIAEIKAARNINSDGTGRNKVSEIVAFKKP
jgi:DNA adenine methylase